LFREGVRGVTFERMATNGAENRAEQITALADGAQTTAFRDLSKPSRWD
jgi:hypothetical protein